MENALEFLASLPDFYIYLVLASGAALENVLPPIPADTFVLLGGFLSSRIGLNPLTVALATWGANTASALAVYGAGRRLGPRFFEYGLGRFLLNRYQLGRLQHFYDRWGIRAVFFTRFLPGLRALVPGFAGVVGEPIHRVIFPLATASAIWYGGLVWAGLLAGENLELVLGWFGQVNQTLLVGALTVFTVVFVWWLRTRRAENEDDDDDMTDGTTE